MQAVGNGSTLTCSMGAGVSPIKVLAPGQGAANIFDNKPMANVGPFALCRSPANPQVAAATAAARGVLVPMPCVPVVPGAWAPGDPMAIVRNAPALTASSTLMCACGGAISVASPIPVEVASKF